MALLDLPTELAQHDAVVTKGWLVPSMAATAHPAPEEPPVGRIRRYWRSSLRFAGAELDQAAASFTYDWPVYLFISLLLAVVVVGSLHTVELFGLRAKGSTVLESLSVTPASALTLLLVGLLVWAYLQIRRDPHKSEGQELHPYVVALFGFALAIGVGVVAFAGVTTLLLQRPATGPSLWTGEQAYIWRVLDAVPLLALPATVGWSQPAVGHDHLSGALLLGFTIALLLPLLRLGVSGYYSAERRVADARKEARRKEKRSAGERLESGELAGFALVALLFVVGIYVLWTYLFDLSSWPTRWLDGLLPESVQVRGVHLGLDWVATIPQWLAVTVVFLVLLIALLGAVVADVGLDKWWEVLAAFVLYACVLMLLTETFVGLLLALTHVGAISMEPGIPPHEQLRAAFSFFVRPVADAVPGLQVPTTVRWPTEARFVGGVGGVLQLVYKLAFFVLILFPVARAIRSVLERPRADEAMVTAAARFGTALGDTRSALDFAEQDVLPEQRVGSTRPQATAPRQRESGASLRRAGDCVRALRPLLNDVERLFGPGPVGEQAELALDAATHRLTAIERARFPVGWSTVRGGPDDNGVRAGLREARASSESARSSYLEAAKDALHGVAAQL